MALSPGIWLTNILSWVLGENVSMKLWRWSEMSACTRTSSAEEHDCFEVPQTCRLWLNRADWRMHGMPTTLGIRVPLQSGEPLDPPLLPSLVKPQYSELLTAPYAHDAVEDIQCKLDARNHCAHSPGFRPQPMQLDPIMRCRTCKCGLSSPCSRTEATCSSFSGMPIWEGGRDLPFAVS